MRHTLPDPWGLAPQVKKFPQFLSTGTNDSAEDFRLIKRVYFFVPCQLVWRERKFL